LGSGLQYLAIGRLHIQSQSDHIVNNHLRRKIALAKAALPVRANTAPMAESGKALLMTPRLM
jgi:hypothetical protein